MFVVIVTVTVGGRVCLQMDMSEAIRDMGALVLKRKVGAGNKIFGNVTHKQVMDAIKTQSKDKGESPLKAPLRAVGRSVALVAGCPASL